MKADSVGGITPAVLVTLSPKEKILASHGLMLYKEPPVQVHRRTMKSLGVSRTHLMGMRARGDEEENYFFAEFEGPGHVAFSRDKGGEVRIFDLPPGQVLRLRDGHLICFDETVRYYPMVLAQYPDPKPDEHGNHPTVYLFADELTGPGTIVYQSYGNVLSFTLNPGEMMRTTPTALLAAANTVGVRVNFLGSAMPFTPAAPPPSAGKVLGGFLSSAITSQLNLPGLGSSAVTTAGGARPAPVLDLVGPGMVLVHSGA